jgi:hypothetical protein
MGRRGEADWTSSTTAAGEGIHICAAMCVGYACACARVHVSVHVWFVRVCVCACVCVPRVHASWWCVWRSRGRGHRGGKTRCFAGRPMLSRHPSARNPRPPPARADPTVALAPLSFMAGGASASLPRETSRPGRSSGEAASRAARRQRAPAASLKPLGARGRSAHPQNTTHSHTSTYSFTHLHLRSYDYQLSVPVLDAGGADLETVARWEGVELMRCRCGAPTCRGVV